MKLTISTTRLLRACAARISATALVMLSALHVARAQAPADHQAISRAYAALAQGRAAEAARIADELLRQSPRDHAGATIAVLAAASTGAGPALDAYERWLDASRHEDAFVLEPVARAVLQELAASRGAFDSEAKARLAASAGDGAERDIAEGRRIAGDLGRKDSGNPILLMRALAKTRYAEGAPAVVPLLGHEVPDVRALAAETLGVLGATFAVPALKAALQDRASEVRSAAAMALHRLGDPSGDDLLGRALTSDIPDLQIQAAEAMANDPPSSWAPYLEPLLTAEAPLTRLHAARLLLPVQPERAGPVLGELLAHPNPVIVGELARTLVQAGLQDVATIRRLLRHSVPEVRLEGATALLRLVGAGA